MLLPDALAGRGKGVGLGVRHQARLGAWAGRVALASVRFAGHPQEVGNEEFLAQKRSHQVPAAVRGAHPHALSRAARVPSRAARVPVPARMCVCGCAGVRVYGCAGVGVRVFGCGCRVWVRLAPTLALTMPWLHEARCYAKPYSDPQR